MKTKIIEATNGFNWGKFMLGRYDADEWKLGSTMDPDVKIPLLRQVGWGRDHLWVLDLQTGEGACYLPGGSATADLHKHRIWVCPLYEPFLHWVYAQKDLTDLEALPARVELPDAPAAMYGYRRSGPHE